MTGKEIEGWADSAMFQSEEMEDGHDPRYDPPRVYFLQGTPDPLGSIAAMSAMYSGKVVRDKSTVTDEERRHHLEEMKKTKLKAPLEAVNLHFMIDGIHRGITHQQVRQRTAVFAQESLRFAVVDGMEGRVALPPSIRSTHDTQPEDLAQYLIDPDNLRMHEKDQRQRWRIVWDHAMMEVANAYEFLVNDGMPQEDARGMLPTNITTRLNYHTNLRNLQDHAGMRLCTQAQFEWRAIWSNMVEAMANYCTDPGGGCSKGDHWGEEFGRAKCDNWQWKEIAGLFRPVCYLTGKCEFGAEVDRKCSIRSRVQANAEIGRPSTEWHKEYDNGGRVVPSEGENPEKDPVGYDARRKPVFIGPIHTAEWLLDPGAAR